MSKFSEALKKIASIPQTPASGTAEPSVPAPPAAPEKITPADIEIEAGSDSSWGNRRSAERYECLIPGYAVVFFDNDVWIGHGAVVNVSENGMLFQFQKSFLKENGLSEAATIRATLYLGDPPAAEGIDVEGKVTHMSLGNLTRFGVHFKAPLPNIVKSFLQN